MAIIFKRITEGCNEHYYRLELEESRNYGEYHIQYEGKNLFGTAIKLYKFWYSGDAAYATNDLGEVYIDPVIFSSEFYPILMFQDGKKGEVEKLIKEGQNARIDAQYKDPVKNDMLDAYSNLTDDTVPQAEG